MTDRPIVDRLAEARRRMHHGLMRPLWADMTPEQRAPWVENTERMVRIAEELGVRFAVEEAALIQAAEELEGKR